MTASAKPRSIMRVNLTIQCRAKHTYIYLKIPKSINTTPFPERRYRRVVNGGGVLGTIMKRHIGPQGRACRGIGYPILDLPIMKPRGVRCGGSRSRQQVGNAVEHHERCEPKRK